MWGSLWRPARPAETFENWMNAAALIICWFAALRFAWVGRAELGAGGAFPDGIRAACDAILDPGTLDRAMHWAWGALSIGVAGALALSAAEGTWWLARRISR